LKSFQIGAALRKAGLRATAPRVAILAAIDGDRSHPSAEDVLARVRRSRPGISFTTVYSTLEALVDRGLLARVTSDPARVRFDTVTERHDHLVCDGCGRIEDLPRKREPATLKRRGWRVTRTETEYHGLCGACHGR
jgi:Fe2+ or Zn2+ uptake regulation protein